jgi:hypothetical protein
VTLVPQAPPNGVSKVTLPLLAVERASHDGRRPPVQRSEVAAEVSERRPGCAYRGIGEKSRRHIRDVVFQLEVGGLLDHGRVDLI